MTFFRIIWWLESSEKNAFIWNPLYNLNVFIVTFDLFTASLLEVAIYLFKKQTSYLNCVYQYDNENLAYE